MEKRYIFHYDSTQSPCNEEIHNMLIAHDRMVCSADITGLGSLDIVKVVFDDGFETIAIVYELQELNGN